ncbi:MAG: ThiF family adenylyltransferase [Nitratireductor sp.]|uniref:ThiF family adenylyltransferase n=1 Tax=Alphaproteobacteria TaxID=28211 RepID=UPI0032663B99
MRIGHTTAEVEIDIPDLEFVELPKIRFVDRSSVSLPIIAHLEEGTGLCYADRSLLRLDRFRPGASILRVLREAEATIAKSLAGGALLEVATEYPSYWGGSNVLVMFGRSTTARTARLAVPNSLNSSTQLLLVNDKQHIPAGFQTGRSAITVHASTDIGAGTNILVPKTLGQLREWYEEQSGFSVPSFGEIGNALSDGQVLFIAARNGWVGCQIELPTDLKLLAKRGARREFLRGEIRKRETNIGLIRYHGSEASLDDITSRNLNGMATSLKGKSIAVVGCGTIGSHLARYLVQSGAGNDARLFLVDRELLAAGNLGRHLLNFADIGESKAEALATELSRFHPDVRIKALAIDVKDVWNRLRGCDLVVDATGVEAVSDYLNQRALEARSLGQSAFLLHTWLFGNGIAAQSFLNVGDGFACYRCLRPDLGKPWLNDPRKDVKDVGRIAATSCGDGPYLPFSVAAPAMAAGLGLQAILDFFDGKPGARLRTIALDLEEARKLNEKSPKPHEQCPACGAGTGAR